MVLPQNLRGQGVPGCERVHLVPPMYDLSAFDLDHRVEPVVVFHAGRDDCPMDLVFDDDHAAVVRLVDNQLIGRVKRDAIDLAPKCGHQIGPPLYHARPTGNVVEDFVDNLLADDLEEVLAINESAQRPSNQIEVWRGVLVDSAFWHSIQPQCALRGCLV
jgi:hypothetical protein